MARSRTIANPTHSRASAGRKVSNGGGAKGKAGTPAGGASPRPQPMPHPGKAGK